MERTVMVCCIDPRNVANSARSYIVEDFGIREIDVYMGPTDGGIVALIADNDRKREEIFESVERIVNGSHVNRVVIVGHEECLLNQVPDEEQVEQIRRACELLRERTENPGIEIYGLFLVKTAQSDEEHMVGPYFGWRVMNVARC
jgi:carbonic anhydrase